VKLEGVAGEFDRGFDGEAIGASNFEAEFSRVALRQERESEKDNAEVKQATHG
jgi:hypothetical protein